MITIINFTEDDYKIIKLRKKGYIVYFIVFFIFLTPVSFLLGFFGLSKNSYGYWPTTVGFLLLFLCAAIYLAIKDYLATKKDLKARLKYSGSISVVKKSKLKKNYFIYTNSSALRKIDVLTVKVFEEIEIGDELYIEATKFGKRILKLNKGPLVLLNGS